MNTKREVQLRLMGMSFCRNLVINLVFDKLKSCGLTNIAIPGAMLLVWLKKLSGAMGQLFMVSVFAALSCRKDIFLAEKTFINHFNLSHFILTCQIHLASVVPEV